MNSIQQAAVGKRSFELNYNGGTIWCEHLDGMGGYEAEVTAKFLEDKNAFSRPSVSSFMIINMDKTDITDQIADTIVTVIAESSKLFRKIAFVGVTGHWRRKFGKIKSKGTVHLSRQREQKKSGYKHPGML